MLAQTRRSGFLAVAVVSATLWLPLDALAQSAAASDLTLYGAGSLREVMTEITTAFTAKTGQKVRTQF